MTKELFDECAKCGGSGTWTRTERRPGSMSMTFHRREQCPDCDGIGAIPTGDGAAVLNLIRRWQRAHRLPQ